MEVSCGAPTLKLPSFELQQSKFLASLPQASIGNCNRRHSRAIGRTMVGSPRGFVLCDHKIEMMKQRLKEASIPLAQKVYCPFPRCFELMSMDQALEFARKEDVLYKYLGARKCVNCGGLLCVNFKVPWHQNMTCAQYKKLCPSLPEDTKLKSLASRNLWRQCVKCNHMIELSEGCYHMTFRL